MRIWVDLANSPQVLFFLPLITELERRGHAMNITSRDFAQTLQLADHYQLRHRPIGGHGGKKLARIGYSVLERAWRLARFARAQHFDLAVSHNSYAQALAAFVLRIPSLTLMDYEHQPANHLCFRLTHTVVVPEYFPTWALRKYGATPQKTFCYHGLKEQVYLTDFVPQGDYLTSIGIPSDRIIVVMRPPGSWGLYHHFENPLFEQVLEYVAQCQDAYIVFLPRISSQGEAVRARGYTNVWTPPQALDGPNLLYHADLVISGGGTMNREAAVLGSPTYSVFKGKQPAVDRYLIEQKRMIHIAEESAIGQIQLVKKRVQKRLTDTRLIHEIADIIESGQNGRSHARSFR